MTDAIQSEALTVHEQFRLAELETVVNRHFKNFIEVGEALLAIRDERLYRATHKTFAEYCRGRWKMTDRHANRLIGGTEVAKSFGPMGLKHEGEPVEIRERHVRPLVGLPPTVRKKVMEAAIEASGGKLTEASVQAEVAKLEDREVLSRARQIRKEREAAGREERLAKIISIASGNKPLDGTIGKFGVIYADPPWRYQEGSTDPTRVIENKYPTMTLDVICELKVPEICTPDCVLYLWATAPKLAEAMEVITAWGFEYRSGYVWDKGSIGPGYWARVQHEHLLVAVRGNPPTPPPEVREGSVIRAKRGEHSAKPDEVAAMIVRHYPAMPKVELFARAPREGWAVWGNEAGGRR